MVGVIRSCRNCQHCYLDHTGDLRCKLTTCDDDNHDICVNDAELSAWHCEDFMPRPEGEMIHF